MKVRTAGLLLLGFCLGLACLAVANLVALGGAAGGPESVTWWLRLIMAVGIAALAIYVLVQIAVLRRHGEFHSALDQHVGLEPRVTEERYPGWGIGTPKAPEPGQHVGDQGSRPAG